MKIRKQMGYKRDNGSSEKMMLVITNDAKNVRNEFESLLKKLNVSGAERRYNLDSFDCHFRLSYKPNGIGVGFELTNHKVITIGKVSQPIIGCLDNIPTNDFLKVYDDAVKEIEGERFFVTDFAWKIQVA